MQPSGDAKSFYKTHLSREARELAEQKQQQEAKKIREILGMNETNRFERKSDGHNARR